MNTESLADSFNRKLRKLDIRYSDYSKDSNRLFKVHVDRAHWRDAHDWCESQFGDDWVWSNPINTNVTTLMFKDESAAILFSLAFPRTIK